MPRYRKRRSFRRSRRFRSRRRPVRRSYRRSSRRRPLGKIWSSIRKLKKKTRRQRKVVEYVTVGSQIGQAGEATPVLRSTTFSLSDNIPNFNPAGGGTTPVWLSNKISPKVYIKKVDLRGGFYCTGNGLYGDVTVAQYPFAIRMMIVRDNQASTGAYGGNVNTVTPPYALPVYEDICQVAGATTVNWVNAFYRRDMGGRYTVLHDKIHTIMLTKDSVYNGSGTTVFQFQPRGYARYWKRWRTNRAKGRASWILDGTNNQYRNKGHLYLIMTCSGRNVGEGIIPYFAGRFRVWFYDNL